MLLDPREEQLHLPACLVERTDGGCRQGHVVGEEHPRLVCIGILESDATQLDGVVRAAGSAGQRHGLIADDARATIHRGRIDAPKLGVRLGAGHEEGVGLMHYVQPGEVEIAAIHDVDRPRLQHQQVEHLDIAQLAVGEVDEAGDIAAQVEQRMHLHRRLGGAKQRPGKERQAQVDGRRIQRVRRVRQLEAKAVAEVERARLHAQALGKFGMDTPIPRLGGIGQRRTRDLLPKAHVVELGGLRRQTRLDVAQTLAIGQLRKGHHAELLGAGHGLHVAIALPAIDNAMEGLPGQEVHELSEQRLANVHGGLREKNRKPARTAVRRSNRRHPSSLEILCQVWLSAIHPFNKDPRRKQRGI